MKKLLCLLVLVLAVSTVYGQGKAQLIEGKVTFTTSRNVYVRFDNTENINVGDTLRWAVDGVLKPCLAVSQKSSASCVCTTLNDCDIQVDDAIFFEYTSLEKKEEDTATSPPVAPSPPKNPVVTRTTNSSVTGRTEQIRGRISAASYSNFSENGDARHRLMSRISLNANNIGDSRLSLETYLNYRQNIITTTETVTQPTKFFRVYNLAAKYDVDSTMSIVVGRKINNKASSLGAIDGLQVEKWLGRNYLGIIAGFRPDIFEYGFNTNLFEYGAYIGRAVNNNKVYAQTTLGLLEQRNAGQIDRRYAYFQHSSTIARKLNLFGSLELDIYEKVNEVVGNSPRLTNLYVSARYRFSRKVNASISYDSRKRILFYETLRTDIERMLDDDESRQGIRFRVNVRPLKSLNVGASFSRRFQSSQQNKSENINGFASLSKLPKVGGNLTVNFNRNSSNYLKTSIVSVRHSRSLVKQKINMDLYYRLVNYNFFNAQLTSNGHFAGMGLNYRLNRELMFSVLGEYAIKPTDNTFRLNFQISKRFNSK
jgi:hypothetical protein